MADEKRLQEFVVWWRQYCRGDEKGEAQIFLDRLFTAFGYEGGLKGAEGDSEKRIKFTLDEKPSMRFADLVIPGRVLIEMKKRGEDLSKHQQQAVSYWLYLTPHPRYVVTCNFDEFWVYDMERQIDVPMAKVPVADLPHSWGPLAFLLPQPQAPTFNKEFDLIELTELAAYSLSEVFTRLTKTGRGVQRDHAQRFILQCMLALFAEDIGLLQRYTFTRVIEACQTGSANSYELFTMLFFLMNLPGVKTGGRFKDVDYFNGGIFQQIYPVQLDNEELRLLREAANHNWGKIRPAIFGTLFETSLEKGERHRIGGHFTYERDILRIVVPVIVRPWQTRIDSAASVDELRALHAELCAYRVLDPACGSGNFLYVAYHEMKKLEQHLFERLRLFGGEVENGQRVSTRQFYGFDINPFAVELAKVTLMIAKKQVTDELDSGEKPLPLDNLDANIRAADALFEPWPAFDACIGNPPYLGAKLLKQSRSVEYVNSVRAKFPDVPGNADYCVYWFRKTHELMKPGARAGLVGTNTIRQNYSRIGGLDYIVAHDGHIYEAVSSIPWSGEAKVHVSIACWSKGEAPFHPARLWLDDGQRVEEVPLINPTLSFKIDVSKAKVISANTEPKRVFQGLTPGHDAFVLKPEEAKNMMQHDRFSKQVIFPYLIGRDLVSEPRGKPSRYLIDLNRFDVLEAQQFRTAFEHIKKHVLPVREAKAAEEQRTNERVLKGNPKAKINENHQQFLHTWWKHSFTRTNLTQDSQKLERFVACARVSKRPIFDFVSTKIRISDQIQAFLFEDDYSFGVLQSKAHWQWFTEKASTLKSDFRYTSHSVFDTFPWPQKPTPAQVKTVADAARRLHEFRRERMRLSETLTLREMYRSLEQPGKNPLKDLHEALDQAVLAAYGFNPDADLLTQMLTLNAAVAARIDAGEAVTAPGIPTDYPNPSELISAGCITPPELI